MGAFYDEEYMVKDAVALFKAQLDTEIGLINTEKADSLTLDLIPATQYIFEALPPSINNYSGYFIFYGITDTPIREVSQDNYLEDVTITFLIGTFDNGEADRSDTFYKLLRYRRALKQVIIKNPNVFRSYAKPLMASLKPDSIQYSNKQAILTIGIELKASVTAN